MYKLKEKIHNIVKQFSTNSQQIILQLNLNYDSEVTLTSK